MDENLVKEELSRAYIRSIAAINKFSCTKPEIDDDSVDFQIAASAKLTPESILRSPRLEIQLKATIDKPSAKKPITFDMPIKNYNDLRGETDVKRLFVVYIMPKNIEDWVSHHEEHLITRKTAYWLNIKGYPVVANKTKVRVHIPRDNVLSPRTLKEIMIKISKREDIGNGPI